MKLIDILPVFEARSNPELNPQISTIDHLRRYKDDPNIFISFTKINKLGINPGSAPGETPLGIYFFPLSIAWKLYKIEETNNFARFPGITSGARFIQVAKWSGKQKFIDGLDTYTKQDLHDDIQKLSSLFGEEQIKNAFTPKKKIPFVALYRGTEALANKSPLVWNKILRNLGYIGFNDHGSGRIHKSEKTQAVFFSTDGFTQIDSFPIKIAASLPDDIKNMDPGTLKLTDMIKLAEKYKTRIKKFEPYILRSEDANIIFKYMYATKSFNSRWKEAEYIMKHDAAVASWYAANYLHRRWYEAEEAIRANPVAWKFYRADWKIKE